MLKYVGNGASLPNVPARDLSYEDVFLYGGEAWLVASGLYVKIEEPKPVRRGKEQPEPSTSEDGET